MHSPNRVPILTSRPQGESSAPLRHPPCQVNKPKLLRESTWHHLAWVLLIYIYIQISLWYLLHTQFKTIHSWVSVSSWGLEKWHRFSIYNVDVEGFDVLRWARPKGIAVAARMEGAGYLSLDRTLSNPLNDACCKSFCKWVCKSWVMIRINEINEQLDAPGGNFWIMSWVISKINP